MRSAGLFLIICASFTIPALLIWGLIGFIPGLIISQIFFTLCIFVSPNYLIKKMDGTEFILKGSDISRSEIKELRKRVK